MAEQRIRAIALCVFQHNGKILVNRFHDPVADQTFYRPIGGGIEFGETSREAIVREVQEELGLSMKDLRLLGTLESLFVYNGKPGHEIVQVYNARFEDAQVYEQSQIVGHESDGSPFTASWQDASSFNDQSLLVPVGLQALLKDAGILG
ncbi:MULTISPECIES: NUDIX hydrolase [unclassified Pseudomonas]|uniref:NUDIX hydrolase n=1 Tax=unclassified Pseudomonas TaxID=196821 RepID=UPI000A1D99E2|nr:MULTISPECIES: NUDIX hydrolase [unclassified Pseudomonas]MDI2144590.1 NUDIX hydrolase [Pseudomonas sp. ITA]